MGTSYAALSHFLTVYHLVTVVDSCCITRSVFSSLSLFLQSLEKLRTMTIFRTVNDLKKEKKTVATPNME